MSAWLMEVNPLGTPMAARVPCCRLSASLCKGGASSSASRWRSGDSKMKLPRSHAAQLSCILICLKFSHCAAVGNGGHGSRNDWGWLMQGIQDAYITISLVDGKGNTIGRPQDTPTTNNLAGNHVLFNCEVSCLSPSQVSMGSVVHASCASAVPA